jgi:hypothetical protein
MKVGVKQGLACPVSKLALKSHIVTARRYTNGWRAGRGGRRRTGIVRGRKPSM